MVDCSNSCNISEEWLRDLFSLLVPHTHACSAEAELRRRFGLPDEEWASSVQMFDEVRSRKLPPVNVVVDTSEDEIEIKDAYGRCYCMVCSRGPHTHESLHDTPSDLDVHAWNVLFPYCFGFVFSG